MTTAEWLEFQSKVFEDLKALTAQKNADYTAGSGDPFANFRGCEDFGVHRLAGLAIRMDDKFQRVKAYLNNGELKVENEGIEDAFKDIIGYAALALGLIEETKDPTKYETIL